jgi:P-type Ca2+ transporter type 2C
MPDFYRLGADETLSQLSVVREQGLSETTASQRREQHGENALPVGEGTSIFKIFIGQFQDLMVIILIIAAIISAFLGEGIDTIVILIIVVLNAALGVYQEYQAEQSLAALSKLQVPQVRVRRDGTVKQISATQLVPGDIVLLEEGDSVPADGRILTSVNMRVEEAALTGESVPSDKNTLAIDKDGIAIGDQHNMVFMGTSVTYGRGEIVVTDTGLKTQIGKIAGMLMGVEEGTTPLQKRLDQLGRTLAIGAGIIVFVVFLVGTLIQRIPIQEMFLTAISLAVAAVPEGLPALVTIGLSLGANRMVKRNALIRRLPAVETLGSVTVICSDKTGTLTKNEMTATYLALPGRDDVSVSGIGYKSIGEFIAPNGQKIDPLQEEEVGRFIKAMALSTNAYLETTDNNPNLVSVVGDTTEGALIVAAQKVGFTREKIESGMPRVAELPFDSDRKAMTTIHEIKSADAKDLFENTALVSITKGAPDKLVSWAKSEHTPEGIVDLSEARRNAWQAQIDKMASEGLRVLGVGYRALNAVPSELNDSIERDLILLGLVGILDPARPEAKEAVKIARQAGIRPIMITGDHALTAQAIAKDLGILTEGQRAITGVELDKMSDDEISKALDQTSAFARVSPAHKLKIVQILQKKGNVVAMTGDGVNDAPALKQADIGVAMGITGTEVSKGASEMVLTDDNFASIVSAVEEGRAIYDNIRKFIKYLLSSNVGEILVMFVALLVGLSLPLLAIQILWINLVTDGLPAIALGFERAEKDVMRRKPRAVKESIFANGVGLHIATIGSLIGIFTLGGFIWGHTSLGMDPFSDTLGLEKFTREELVAVVRDEALVADNWDSLSDEEQILLIEGVKSEEEASTATHEVSAGILGAAERVPRTIAFTILAFTQMFEVMAIHAGDRQSFFTVFFSSNMLLLYAILSTFALQLAVIYIPFMQTAFETAPLTAPQMAVTAVLGFIVLIAVEIEKSFRRRYAPEFREQLA